MLVQCWARIVDGCPTMDQHWVNLLCLHSESIYCVLLGAQRTVNPKVYVCKLSCVYCRGLGMPRSGDVEVWGCRGLGMPRSGDAEVWGCRGRGMPRSGDAEVRGCRGRWMPRSGDAEVWGCRGLGMPSSGDAIFSMRAIWYSIFGVLLFFKKKKR